MKTPFTDAHSEHMWTKEKGVAFARDVVAADVVRTLERKFLMALGSLKTEHEAAEADGVSFEHLSRDCHVCKLIAELERQE